MLILSGLMLCLVCLCWRCFSGCVRLRCFGICRMCFVVIIILLFEEYCVWRWERVGYFVVFGFFDEVMLVCVFGFDFGVVV